MRGRGRGRATEKGGDMLNMFTCILMYYIVCCCNGYSLICIHVHADVNLVFKLGSMFSVYRKARQPLRTIQDPVSVRKALF